MRPICPLCDGKGARTLHYHSGAPFDVALCTCAAGAILRLEIDAKPEQLERRFGVSIDRIWPLEDLLEGSPQAAASTLAVIDDDALLAEASRVGERAGLSGKAAKR